MGNNTVTSGLRQQKKSFMSKVMLLMIGVSGGQVITIIASVPVARLYNPSDIGLFTLVTSACALFLSIASLRYEFAILLPKRYHTAFTVTWVALLVVPLMVLLFTLAIASVGIWIMRLIRGEVIFTLWILPVVLTISAVVQVGSSLQTRLQRFKVVSTSRLLQSGAQAVVQVAAGLFHTGILGLVIGYVAGQIVAALSIWQGLYGALWDAWQRTSYSSVKRVAYRYRQFPLISAPSTLVNTLGLQMPNILIASLYGSEVGGFFGMAQRVVEVPVLLIVSSVSQAFISEAAEKLRKSRRSMNEFLDRTVRWLVLIGLAPTVGFALGAPTLFSLIFGQKWESSGNYVRLMCLMMLARICIVPISQTLNLLQLNTLQLLWDCVRLLTIASSIVLPWYVGCNADTMIFCYSVTSAANYLFYFVLIKSVDVFYRKHESKKETT